MNASKSRTLSGRHRRWGTTYVLVISTAMLVTIIGLGSLSIARVELRAARNNWDAIEARAHAQSAIEWGLVMTRRGGWQVNLGTGTWVSGQTIGKGSFSLDVTILTDQPAVQGLYPATLVGTGVCRNATHKVQVTVVPQDGGMVVDPGTWTHIVN